MWISVTIYRSISYDAYSTCYEYPKLSLQALSWLNLYLLILPLFPTKSPLNEAHLTLRGTYILTLSCRALHLPVPAFPY